MPREWTVKSPADLGRAVAEIRTRRGLTQKELAAQAALSRTYLSHIESGRSSRLIEHALRTLRRLGATVTISIPDDGEA